MACGGRRGWSIFKHRWTAFYCSSGSITTLRNLIPMWPTPTKSCPDPGERPKRCYGFMRARVCFSRQKQRGCVFLIWSSSSSAGPGSYTLPFSIFLLNLPPERLTSGGNVCVVVVLEQFWSSWMMRGSFRGRSCISCRALPSSYLGVELEVHGGGTPS